ncbi:uncharacterized protein [Anabrus simplex]|uniref:uncharacterized protein n=1 Tax=Anabrus simplex TaxID=316456 RepID=UPI0035A38538
MTSCILLSRQLSFRALIHTSCVRLDSLTNIPMTGSKLRARGCSITPAHRIIRCPYPDIEIPRIPITELVWGRIAQWQDKPALTCGVTGRRYTYAEARDVAHRFGAALLNQGFKKGDLVALCLPNVPEYPLIFLGTLEAGLSLTAINTHYSEEKISSLLVSSSPKVIVTTPELIVKVRKAAKDVPSCHTFITVANSSDEHPQGCLSFSQFVEQKTGFDSVKFPDINPNDLAVIPYTNGTTGPAKGVKLSHFNLVANVRQITHEAFDQGRDATESFQEVIVVVVPMSHIFGMVVVMLARMCLGTHIITVPNPDPKIYIKCLSEHKSTVLGLTTSLMFYLASFRTLPYDLLGDVHTVMYGGSPIASDNVATFMARLKPSVVFQQGYGMTETTSAVTQTSRWERKLGTCGYLVPNTQAKVIDTETGVALGSGHIGEILVKGPQVMMGYLNNEAAQMNKFDEEGWLITGDLGFYDDEHCFHIVDRLDDLIHVTVMHTLPVAPAEIEELLRAHPGVAEAAVVGVKDPEAGEVPRAFVVRRPTFYRLTEQELLDLIVQKLPPYKRLSGGVKFVDSLPKTPTGNVQRFHLKENSN